MADARSAVETGSPAASQSKMLVIVLTALLAAGAAAGGVYFFLSNQASATTGEKQRTVAKAAALYVKFEPPLVVNFESRGMTRFLQVSIEIMTRDASTASMLQQHDPRLRNDLLMLLGNQGYETLSTREGKERLRGEALQTVAEVVAAEGGDATQVEQLYFTSFVMQ